MKLVFGIEYNGCHFKGWQRQPELRTVQGCLEQALSKIADESIIVVCAGRTDVGVHGCQQVVHVETQVKRTLDNWLLGTNSLLPADIRVLWVKPVADDFHARFSALARHYHYLIDNSPQRGALRHGFVAWEHAPLEVASMAKAAEYFLGEQDFSSFQASACQSKSSVRTIYHLRIHKRQSLILIDIKANAFLQHMVRNIAGVLMAIGKGQQSAAWVKDVLAAKDRRQGGVTAPSSGLYFMNAEYPKKFDIPINVANPIFLYSIPIKEREKSS